MNPMNRSFSVLVSALIIAASAVVSGCSSDCENLCEEGKSCSGATAEVKNADCAKTCSDQEANATKAGCADQLDKLYSCTAGADLTCGTENSACATEALAFASCQLDYCGKNPDEPECQASP
ncbi:MAG TPA: hypothetical protein PK156_41335 [Polyangium sp.]|nr:hypothetical protein [Polyangium sp.]